MLKSSALMSDADSDCIGEGGTGSVGAHCKQETVRLFAVEHVVCKCPTRHTGLGFAEPACVEVIYVYALMFG